MQDPDPRDVQRAAKIFKVLSHPDRLRLVCLMTDGESRTQKELVEAFGWPQSTTARHVAKLRDLGLVASTRSGQEIQLALGTPVVNGLMEAVCEWVHPETGESFSGNPADIYAEKAS